MVGHRRIISMSNVATAASQAITKLAACFFNVKCSAISATQVDDRGGAAGIMVCYLKSLPVRQFDPSSVLNGGAGEATGCATRVSTWLIQVRPLAICVSQCVQEDCEDWPDACKLLRLVL